MNNWWWWLWLKLVGRVVEMRTEGWEVARATGVSSEGPGLTAGHITPKWIQKRQTAPQLLIFYCQSYCKLCNYISEGDPRQLSSSSFILSFKIWLSALKGQVHVPGKACVLNHLAHYHRQAHLAVWLWEGQNPTLLWENFRSSYIIPRNSNLSPKYQPSAKFWGLIF